jgi:hypothetical protein
MADIELVIKIPEEIYESSQIIDVKSEDVIQIPLEVIANGTPLPKGHGKLVDISKIDKDRIESDNPIIYLTINGQYTEAISLDYLNDLPTIIEADQAESEDKE